MGNLLTR